MFQQMIAGNKITYSRHFESNDYVLVCSMLYLADEETHPLSKVIINLNQILLLQLNFYQSYLI
jgi:hypothetical protein